MITRRNQNPPQKPSSPRDEADIRDVVRWVQPTLDLCESACASKVVSVLCCVLPHANLGTPPSTDLASDGCPAIQSSRLSSSGEEAASR